MKPRAEEECRSASHEQSVRLNRLQGIHECGIGHDGSQKLDLLTQHRLHPSKVVRWVREKLTAQSSLNLVFVSFEE
jgi:hypothetical protein